MDRAPAGLWDSSFAASERRNRRRWERDVRNAGHAQRFNHRNRVWSDAGFGAGSWRIGLATATRVGLALKGHLPRLRFAILGLTATSAAAAAVATALAVQAYNDNPPSRWAEIKASRRHSPIYDVEGRLAGSVGAPDGKLDLEARRNLAYIELREPPPRTWVAAATTLEDRNFDKPGLLSFCGIDIASMLRRWVLSPGVAGGSGIVQQYTRQLTGWGRERGFFEKVSRKFKEIGASCSVWKAYESTGGADGILADYASTAPMFQGGGTLRGLEASSQVAFGVKPAELSDGQQLVLAAAIRLPIPLLRTGDENVPCEQVYPKSGKAYDAALAVARLARATQCRVLARAIGVAPKVLEGDRLQTALKELAALQHRGIHVVNEFQPLPAARLVNLTARTHATLPPIVTRMLVSELDDLPGFKWGTSLFLTVDANAQRGFSRDIQVALREVERTARTKLCIPLTRAEPRVAGFSRLCGRAVQDDASADVVAVKMKVGNGAVIGAVMSSPILIDAPVSAGSLAKWVIALAAVKAGISADSEWCPRRVRDGDRQLRRVGAEPYGYTDAQCARGGKYLMPLAEGFARSDNLVAAEVARYLGDERLRAALESLGLEAERNHELWYGLAFGTQPATPRKLLAAGRAVVAAAYGVRLVGSGPRVLAAAGDEAALGSEPTVLDTLTPAARSSLKRLLEAPTAIERGTLGFLGHSIDAGKSGTTSSDALDVNGHRNVHGKLALMYQADQDALNLLIVAAPKSSVPLALHDLPGSALAPVHRALLQRR